MLTPPLSKTLEAIERHVLGCKYLKSISNGEAKCADPELPNIKGICVGDSQCSCKIDEDKNYLGKHRCFMDKECDGRRRCVLHNGYFECRGTSQCDNGRTPDGCNIEKNSPYGQGKCLSDSDCNHNRKCKIIEPGHCEGASGCECNVNEAHNKLGRNRCINDSECDGMRMCHYRQCVGNSACKNRQSQMQHRNICSIDEFYNPLGN